MGLELPPNLKQIGITSRLTKLGCWEGGSHGPSFVEGCAVRCRCLLDSLIFRLTTQSEASSEITCGFCRARRVSSTCIVSPPDSGGEGLSPVKTQPRDVPCIRTYMMEGRTYRWSNLISEQIEQPDVAWLLLFFRPPHYMPHLEIG